MVIKKTIGNFNNQGSDVIISKFGYNIFLGINLGYIVSTYGKKISKASAI